MERTGYIFVFGMLLSGLLVPVVGAQQVTATVSGTTIGTEETLRYMLKIEGASTADLKVLKPPETENLEAINPTPSRQTNVAITNGQIERSIGFQWVFRPLGEGPARFLATRVSINGTVYTVASIDITVVPQAQRPARRRSTRSSIFDSFGGREETAPAIDEGDIFIRVLPSASEAYQNEQVVITYELFFRSDLQLRQSRLADSWDAEGFWREDLNVDTTPVPRISIENGVRYASILLKRVAVFPARDGMLMVDPLRIETHVEHNFSVFRRTPHEAIERASASVEIESVSLPPGAPRNFTGAVGDYNLHAEVSRDNVEVGESLQLTIRLQGSGNLALLEMPALSLPGIFETYEPEVETSIVSTGDHVHGSKTFTYLLVPRSNGTFTLPAVEFAYFNPRAEEYRTLTSPEMPIRVTGTASSVMTRGILSTGLPVDDIARPLSASRWVRVPQIPLHRQLWPYIILCVPLLFIGLTVFLRRRATRLATDMAYARNRRAHPLARKHLKRAVALKEEDSPRDYYEELERAVLGFLGNRLNIAELGLTRMQLDKKLAAIGLTEDLRSALQAFLRACDAARFAPQRPSSADMEASLKEAQDFIATLNAVFQAKGY